MAAGLTAGAALVGYGISRADLLIMGAVTGLGVGALRALVLSRSRVAGAFWWAVANPPQMSVGPTHTRRRNELRVGECRVST